MFRKNVVHLLCIAVIILVVAIAFIFYKLYKIEGRLNRIDPFSVIYPKYGANLDSLRSFPFPDNPSRESLRKYVFDVVLSAKGQTSFSDNDPQIYLLVKVGEDNMDILLEVARVTDRIERFHINSAISILASDKTKSLILEALPEHQELASILLDHKWESEAKDVLLDALKEEPTYVPPEWILAVINLNDPCANKAALNYFVHGPNKHRTYKILSSTLEVDMAPYVAKAWEDARDGHWWDKVMMAPVAMRYGHEDAIEVAIQNLKKFVNRHILREALLSYTEATGTDEMIVEWYEKNRDHLYFDSKSNKFRAKR